MAIILSFLFSLMLCLANAQPSPGYYPSSKLRPISFYDGYNNLWGPQHQSISKDQSSLTIWLDKNTGSGFKSKLPFRSGYFAASIKLQSGYTAGVITALYLSNNQAHPGFHDEVDIEFLGTIPGKPYTLQTNVYVMGSGDGRIIGREMRFHLWFDPTADFHNYAILWNHVLFRQSSSWPSSCSTSQVPSLLPTGRSITFASGDSAAAAVVAACIISVQ